MDDTIILSNVSLSHLSRSGFKDKRSSSDSSSSARAGSSRPGSLFGKRSGRMSVSPLAGVESLRLGSVGGGGAGVGLLYTLLIGGSTFCGTHPFSVVRDCSGLSADFYGDKSLRVVGSG